MFVTYSPSMAVRTRRTHKSPEKYSKSSIHRSQLSHIAYSFLFVYHLMPLPASLVNNTLIPEIIDTSHIKPIIMRPISQASNLSLRYLSSPIDANRSRLEWNCACCLTTLMLIDRIMRATQHIDFPTKVDWSKQQISSTLKYRRKYCCPDIEEEVSSWQEIERERQRERR